MSENLRHIKETLHGIDALKHEVALRLGLLGQVRPAQDSARVELIVALTRLNGELEMRYRDVKACATRSEEDACMAEIHRLEDERFQLLNRLNGDQVKNYGLHPVKSAP